MSRTLTAADRKALIRLASTLEKGSDERKAILAGLETQAPTVKSAARDLDITDEFKSLADKYASAVADFVASLTGGRVSGKMVSWPEGDGTYILIKGPTTSTVSRTGDFLVDVKFYDAQGSYLRAHMFAAGKASATAKAIEKKLRILGYGE
jgi:hypothetical protein